MAALFSAIKQERMYQIRFLFLREDIDLEYSDKNGYTALIICNFMTSFWKSLVVTRMLLGKNISKNRKDMHGRTALTHACINGNHMVAKILLQTNDIESNTIDSSGFTNLMYSVLSGNESLLSVLVQYLQKYQIYLDDRTEKGSTAYMFAIKEKQYVMANILKKAGASTDIFDFEKFVKCKNLNKSNMGAIKHSVTKRKVNFSRRSQTAPGSRSGDLQITKSLQKDNPYQHDVSLQYANLNKFIELFNKSAPNENEITKNKPRPSLHKHMSGISQGSFIVWRKPIDRPIPATQTTPSLCQLINESVLSQDDSNERLRRVEKSKRDRKLLKKRESFENLVPRISICVEDNILVRDARSRASLSGSSGRKSQRKNSPTKT